MKAPKIPSFIKLPETPNFNFEPRYYQEKKENKVKKYISFNNQKSKEKHRKYQIISFIFILSLLSYIFLI